MVESIFAAVFIDKGIDVAEQFILAVMHTWLQKVDPDISDKDAKTRLQEYLQKQGFPTPCYSLIEKSGKDHLQTFKMKCTVVELQLTEEAVNRSRKKAEQQAAEKILNKIKKHHE